MSAKGLSAERWVLLVLCIAAVSAVAFMGQIVEPPKVLLGQMLTSISPSLFPTLVLSTLAALTAALFFLSKNAPESKTEEDRLDATAIRRGVMFFGCMLLYALTMEPIGFYLSSALVIVLVSLLTGNRIYWQIACLAFVGPAALYLMATRLLAVSLPELNTIELFYAQQLGL